THRTRSVTGAQGMVGEKARVYTWNPDGTGKVFCHGEYWNARGPADLKPGDQVEVERLEGLVLDVRRVSPSPHSQDPHG
ncbi:MAG TPA: NfeD family protein, partial [Deltaproteobacteria bacterium]|nr:NfeD family protein [Deltaproteobacteria bacterium]